MPSKRTKVKPTKGYAVAYNGKIDVDAMKWGGYAYTIFISESDAIRWLGRDVVENDPRITEVLITPFKKGKE